MWSLPGPKKKFDDRAGLARPNLPSAPSGIRKAGGRTVPSIRVIRCTENGYMLDVHLILVRAVVCFGDGFRLAGCAIDRASFCGQFSNKNIAFNIRIHKMRLWGLRPTVTVSRF
jgi:hypothetical protein